ncbi:MAG: hypothetical protein ABSE73_18350 [Planctomycetota bacterium]
MKPAFLITEGKSDQLVLRSLLPKETVKRLKMVAGNGRYSAISQTESILAMGGRPVAVVVDADTSAVRAVEELREMLQFGLRQAASGTPYLLRIAVPEIEFLLLSDERDILALTHKEPDSKYETCYAREHPKQYLQEKFPALAKNYIAALPEFLAALPASVKERARKSEFIQGLVAFTEKVSNVGAAPALQGR